MCAVILAAGKGTRIKAPSDKNKVVFDLAGKPMVAYTVEMLKNAGLNEIVVVVGHASDSVKKALGNKVTYVTQQVPMGTGDAVKVAMEKVPTDCKQVISMYGDDSAFYTKDLLVKMVAYHEHNKAAVTLVTIKKNDPTGLGRIVRNSRDEVTEIVEEKVASDSQKKIKEINTGLYCFDRDFLARGIEKIKKNPVSKEYYLTDIVAVANSMGQKVVAMLWEDEAIWYGVNTREQWRMADRAMRVTR